MSLHTPLPQEFGLAVAALRRLRIVRVGLLEAQIVDLICAELEGAGLEHRREVILAPGARIDVAIPSQGAAFVGVEVKKGRPNATSAAAQVARYAQSGRLLAIIFVAERTFDLPPEMSGVPVAAVSLQASMGIAL